MSDEEPKMVGCGHAFEYTTVRISVDPEALNEWLNNIGVKGWEAMFISGDYIYLKRKIPTAYELKMIAEAEEAAETLKAALRELQGGSDGQPTH